MTTYKAHIFKQKSVGSREEVKLKLFKPDGTLIDLSKGNGGGGAWAWLSDTNSWAPPVGSFGYVAFSYGGSNSEALGITTGAGGAKQGIEIREPGIYLVQAYSVRPPSVNNYVVHVKTSGNEITIGLPGIDFGIGPGPAHSGFVIIEPEESLETFPLVRLRTMVVSGTPAPIDLRELAVARL